MSPSRLHAAVVAERTRWVREMLASIRSLPLDSREAFIADPRTSAAAESFLRRALEALLDLGRHMLAKGFARAPAEYKAIAKGLEEVGILSKEEATIFTEMAGYRNRLTHFYHEVTVDELYQICTQNLEDVERILSSMLVWIRENPDRIDDRL